MIVGESRQNFGGVNLFGHKLVLGKQMLSHVCYVWAADFQGLLQIQIIALSRAFKWSNKNVNPKYKPYLAMSFHHHSYDNSTGKVVYR